MLPLFRKIFFFFCFLFIIFLFLAPKSVEAAEAKYYYYYYRSPAAAVNYSFWSNEDLSGDYYREDYYNFPTNPADNTYINQCSLPDWTPLPDMNSCQKNLGAAENTCCTSSSCSSSCGTIGTWNWCYANGCKVKQVRFTCDFQYQYNYQLCGNYDSCTATQPYLNPGLCTSSGCQVSPTVYKTCCYSNGTVDGTCVGGQFSGGCPSGSTAVMCGVGGGTCAAVYPYPCATASCGQSACSAWFGAPTPTPGGPTPTPTPAPSTPTPTPIPFVCVQDLITGALDQPCPNNGTFSSPVSFRGRYWCYNCVNFSADPTQSYVSVDGAKSYFSTLPGASIGGGNFSASLNIAPGVHTVFVHVEGYSSDQGRNGVTELPAGNAADTVNGGCGASGCSNRRITIVAPTPTPPPVTIRFTDARCPPPGTSASVYWTGTGPIDHYYYTYRARPDSWPAQTLTSATNLTFASTAGKTYDFQASACNVSNTDCASALTAFSCSNWILPPMPKVTPNVPCVNGPYSGSEVTIDWASGWNPPSARTDPNYYVRWVDISPNTSFSPNYHKEITSPSTYAVYGPVGFNLDPSNPPKPLPAQPGTTYYVRLFNNDPAGNHSSMASFSIPPCSASPAPTSAPGVPTSTPTPLPSAGPAPTAAPGAPTSPTVTAVCGGTSATLTLNRPSGTTYYQVTINSVMIAPSFPALTDPIIFSYGPTGRGLTYLYSVTACNAANLCSAPTSGNFTCPNTITPWIFVDGDVHSNTGINTPGGP